MKNNNLEFVKKRITDGFTKMNLDDFESLSEYNVLEILSEYLDKNGEYKVMLDNNFNIILKVDSDATFDYFTMKSCRCDGTMMFYNQLMVDCLNNILSCGTYPNNVTLPEDLSNKTFIYTVGNFVLGHEYDEQKFKTEEKPWIYSRFTAMLPIKFEIIGEE